MNRRNLLPDVLKGLAVILMIQVHINEQFASYEFFNSVGGRISLFLGGFPAAPVFMLIMGWYAHRSKPLKTELGRAAKLLAMGLLLNIALNANLFIHSFLGTIQIDRLAYLFGVDILFLAGLSLFIVSLLKRILYTKWWALMLAAIVVIILTPIIGSDSPASGIWRYIRPFIADNFAWWSYFPLFPWLAYVLAGMAASALAGQNPYVWSYSGNRIVKSVVTLLFLAGVCYGWHISTNLHLYYHHNFLFFGWAIVSAGVLAYCLEYFIRIIPGLRNLSWVGRNVTTIYIIQWIIIGNLSTWLYRTQSGAALFLWFMFITLITISLLNLIQGSGKKIEEII